MLHTKIYYIKGSNCFVYVSQNLLCYVQNVIHFRTGKRSLHRQIQFVSPRLKRLTREEKN
jgi:hypothetical protein